ncbi:hypothetical protein F5883DRAFT_438806 [Diaporthe sp. PMI_573]|nr:hypothetical protein F5883DRAFT_438806 [Diaporthaceae sp. PMI_573]
MARSAGKHRRHHEKSRTGCLDCRRRRVKCDEQKPSCRACVRRQVACDYTRAAVGASTSHQDGATPPRSQQESPASQVPAPDPSVISSAGTPSNASPQAALLGPATPSSSQPVSAISDYNFRLEDLALHHQWTMHTSLTISVDPDFVVLWQRIIPQIGFQHPFLTHSLLSIAALHLAHGRDPRETSLISQAAEHHNEALRGFREAVADITESNSEALFTWSLMNMIYVFAVSTIQGRAGAADRPTRASTKDVILGGEWIPMVRGIDAVLAPTHNYLLLGRMAILMSLGNWDDLDPGPLSSHGPDGHLCQTHQIWANSGDAGTYDEALHILRRCRLFMQQFKGMDPDALAEWGYNRARAGPILFIHYAPAAYFTLLQQRQPPALILFAHFGVLLHDVKYFWFIGTWGKEIVEVVRDLLGSYWAPWMSWPLDFVGSE